MSTQPKMPHLHFHNKSLRGYFCRLFPLLLLSIISITSHGQEKKHTQDNETVADTRSNFLSSHGLTVYADAAKKWNEDVEKLAARNNQESNPDSILFIGSSTIRLWDTLEQDVAPYKTIKRGYGGAKFCDLAIHCPQLVDGLNYRAVVVFVANDITGGVSDKEPAEIKRLARVTIESLKARVRSAPVIILSITATPSRFSHWKRIQSANMALSTLANEMQGVYFLETEKHYLTDDGKPIENYFVEDRLHQTPLGYQLLGSLVKSKLDEILPQNTSR